jgi:drug/metabolite transporter (DMT)-like permease
LLWGTTWAAIRIGLQGVPPFLGVSLRFAIAGVLLFALAFRMRVRFGAERREKALWVVNALFSYCISYGVVYWAEQWVPSGLGSVLFATFPLFVSIIARFALPAERLGPAAILGLLIGFGGVAVIFSEDLAALGGPGVAQAALVFLISPLSAATASVAIKKWGARIHPLSITTVPMVISAAVMGAVAAMFERSAAVTWDVPSVGALLYLAVFGSAVTFSLYFWLLKHTTAIRVSLIAYTTPVIAVTVGAVFLDEPVTARMLVGTVLVIGGVALAGLRLKG